MRALKIVSGSILLTAAFLAACGDTSQPLGPDSALDQARAGQTCTITDDAQGRVRTVSAGCANEGVTVPQGWTLKVIGEAAPSALRFEVSPNFTPIPNPEGTYLETNLIDISGIADFTNLTSVSDPPQTVTFSVTMNKRSVPDSWGTWGSPPFTEGAFPHILFTGGAQTIEMTLAVPSAVFGFELNPNPFALHTFTADFYSGGTLVGSITREISGDAGARLLAAEAPEGQAFDRVVVTGSSDFAIARLRWSEGQIEQPIDVEIEDVYSGNPRQAPGVVSAEDEWLYVEILDPLQYRPNGLGANPFRTADQVRIGDSFATGTPAESYQLLDINNDGNLDIRLRWSIEELLDDGNLTCLTEEIEVWGDDNGQRYHGEHEVEIIDCVLPPDPVIDQNQPDASVYMAAFAQTDLAQSFQTQQGVLPTVGAGIFLQPGVGGTDNVRISLWNALPNAGGTMLAQGQAMGTQGEWVDIIFNNPVLLTPNTTYYLVFDGNLSLGIAGSIANPYPHGHVFANPGFTPFPNFDYTFRTWIAAPGGESLSPGHLEGMKTMSPSGSVRPNRGAPATQSN